MSTNFDHQVQHARRKRFITGLADIGFFAEWQQVTNPSPKQNFVELSYLVYDEPQ